MTAIQEKSSHLLCSKKIIIFLLLLLLVGLVIFVGIRTYKSPIQRKLIGSWNIEMENSYMQRDSLPQLLGIIMRIENNGIINLPSVDEPLGIDLQGRTISDGILEDDEIGAIFRERFSRMHQISIGTWQIISRNPDSIFIDAPKNPFHGRYAIRFFIDERGWIGANMRNNIFKMELTNDSTSLILNKGGIMTAREIRPWNNIRER